MVIKLSETEMQDVIIHEHHELTLENIKWFGIVLKCLDCKMNILLFTDKLGVENGS